MIELNELKKNLNFLNGALHILTLEQNSLNIFLGGEIRLDCFEFFFLKKANKHTHAVFYLFNNLQPGLVKFRDTNFYPFFFFEMISFSLLVTKRAHVTAQVQITSSGKKNYCETCPSLMF